MKKSFLKSKTVHGVKTGNHSNPNVLKAARASGGSCMAAEGASARPSMSKPRMMRADGGEVRASDEMKAKATELRKKADDDQSMAKTHLGVGTVNTAASLMARKRMPGLSGMNAMGALWNGYEGLKSTSSRDANLKEADRLERGMAEDGKEDRRKNGGGVMPRFNPKKKGC